MHLRIAVAVFFAAWLAGAQPPTQDPGSLKFEVASVKPTPAGVRGGTARPEPGGRRYRGTNLPLKLYISSAYRIKTDQVVGAPGWTETEGFDIEAQAEKPSTMEELHLMMRNLLADRFHLRFHWETKEMSMYALTVDKSGSRLTPHNAANAGDPWIEQTRVMPFHAKWIATFASMDLFAFRLSAIMDRPVIDQTGLKGDYDFTLTYTMDLPPNIPPNALLNGQPIDTTGPTIFQALQQQLGLRLEPRKGPVPVMVIDHVEKPGEN